MQQPGKLLLLASDIYDRIRTISMGIISTFTFKQSYYVYPISNTVSGYSAIFAEFQVASAAYSSVEAKIKRKPATEMKQLSAVTTTDCNPVFCFRENTQGRPAFTEWASCKKFIS